MKRGSKTSQMEFSSMACNLILQINITNYLILQESFLNIMTNRNKDENKGYCFFKVAFQFVNFASHRHFHQEFCIDVLPAQIQVALNS